MNGFLRYSLATTIALLLGELYIRGTRPYLTPETLRAQSLQYEQTVFARDAFPRIAQPAHQINALGYRGAFTVRKPPGTVRIIVMGGSGAFDPGAPPGRDWPHLVGSLLRTRGHQGIEVINAAIPGHATPDAVGVLFSEAWTFEPDYVVLYESWNDIKYMARLGSQVTLLRHLRPPPAVPGSLLVDNPFIYYANPVDRLLCASQVYVRLRARYLQWRMHEFDREGAWSSPAAMSATSAFPTV
jgi:hypothetical protein